MIKRKLILELVKIKDQRKLIVQSYRITQYMNWPICIGNQDYRESNKDGSLGTKWRD